MEQIPEYEITTRGTPRKRWIRRLYPGKHFCCQCAHWKGEQYKMGWCNLHNKTMSYYAKPCKSGVVIQAIRFCENCTKWYLEDVFGIKVPRCLYTRRIQSKDSSCDKFECDYTKKIKVKKYGVT